MQANAEYSFLDWYESAAFLMLVLWIHVTIPYHSHWRTNCIFQHISIVLPGTIASHFLIFFKKNYFNVRSDLLHIPNRDGNRVRNENWFAKWHLLILAAWNLHVQIAPSSSSSSDLLFSVSGLRVNRTIKANIIIILFDYSIIGFKDREICGGGLQFRRNGFRIPNSGFPSRRRSNWTSYQYVCLPFCKRFWLTALRTRSRIIHHYWYCRLCPSFDW